MIRERKFRQEGAHTQCICGETLPKLHRYRPSTGWRCISCVVLKNEGSLVQTCGNINVLVVTQINVETYMNAYDQSMNAIYVHSISYKIVTKHDTRHARVSIFFWRNVRVAINFTAMLLVAHKQPMLLLETLKSYESSVAISKWCKCLQTLTRCKCLQLFELIKYNPKFKLDLFW